LVGVLLGVAQPGVASSVAAVGEPTLRVSLQSPTPVVENPPGFVAEEQSVEWTFPKLVTFTLKTRGFPFRSAYLNYESSNYGLDGFEGSKEIAYGAPTSAATFTLDLRRSFFPPPGATIDYHWVLEDLSGNMARTPVKSFTLTDNRYDWRTNTGADGRVTVYWHASNQTIGPSVAERASRSLARIEGLMGHTYNKPIVIWVYTDLADLHSALSDSSSDWVGGQALSEWGVIQVFIPNAFTTELEIAMAIPHEISHLVFYQASYPGQPPYWLNEGMAMLNQEEFIAEREITPLREAAEDDRLIPLEELDDAFTTNDSEKALLAYAQSRNLVEFIVGRYGRQSVGRTLAAFREGVTQEEALQKGIGVTLAELEEEWRAALPYKPRRTISTLNDAPATSPDNQGSQAAGQWLSVIPGITCVLLVLGLAVLSIMSWMQRRKARAVAEEGEI
jgi:hypothetical protein